MGGLGVGLTLVLFVVAIVLVIAWIVLPFAIIGTKPLLQELIAETRKTNTLLERLGTQNSALAGVRADASKVA